MLLVYVIIIEVYRRVVSGWRFAVMSDEVIVKINSWVFFVISIDFHQYGICSSRTKPARCFHPIVSLGRTVRRNQSLLKSVL